MTSINSLTAIASGDITNVSSVLMYVVDNLNSAKMSLGNLQDIGLGDIGAMWTLSADIGLASVTTTVVSYDGLVYDTGSWTNPASTGLFRVPDDRWSFIQVGMNLQTNNANLAQVSVYVNGVFGYPGSAINAMNGLLAGNLARFSTISAPMQVSSGDILQPYFFTSLANTLQASEYTNFWIRGIKRRG